MNSYQSVVFNILVFFFNFIYGQNVLAETCQNLPGKDYACNYFASPEFGYCKKITYLNGTLFSIACKKSCNLCPGQTTTSVMTTSQSSCVDKASYCAYWSALCMFLILENPHPCAKTCNLCSVIPTTSTRTTTTLANINCVDTSTTCQTWVNYCYVLAGLNPHPCRKTCKLC